MRHRNKKRVTKVSRLKQDVIRLLACDSECGFYGDCGRSNHVLGPAPSGWRRAVEHEITSWLNSLPKGRKRDLERWFRSALSEVFPGGVLTSVTCGSFDRAERWDVLPLDGSPRRTRLVYAKDQSTVGVELRVCPEASGCRIQRLGRAGREYVVDTPEKWSGRGGFFLADQEVDALGNDWAMLEKRVLRDRKTSVALIRKPELALQESLLSQANWETEEDLLSLLKLCKMVAQRVVARQDRALEVFNAKIALVVDEVAVDGAPIPSPPPIHNGDLKGWVHRLETQYANQLIVVLVAGDNFPILRAFSSSKEFDALLSDPPYNTGNRNVYRYSDRNEDSLWQRGLALRLEAAKGALREDGVVGLHIDDNSTHQLRAVMDGVFGPGGHLGTLVWRKKVVRGRGARYLLPHTEYVHFYGNSDEGVCGFSEPLDDRMRSEYTLEDEKGPYKRIPLAKTGTSQSPRPNLVYPICAPDGTSIPCPTAQWRWSQETLANRWDEIEFIRGKDGRWRVFTKQYLFTNSEERRRTPSSLYTEATTSDGTREIKDLFGKVAADFPKPTRLLGDILEWVESAREGGRRLRYLEPYAGSASFVHAVLDRFRADLRPRTIIAVENGPHIEELTAERVRRTIASDRWKKGQPVGEPRKGIVFAFLRVQD